VRVLSGGDAGASIRFPGGARLGCKYRRQFCAEERCLVGAITVVERINPLSKPGMHCRVSESGLARHDTAPWGTLRRLEHQHENSDPESSGRTGYLCRWHSIPVSTVVWRTFSLTSAAVPARLEHWRMSSSLLPAVMETVLWSRSKGKTEDLASMHRRAYGRSCPL
jgi:hypothetical protein